MGKNQQGKKFYFWEAYWDAMCELTDEERGVFLGAMCAYVFDDVYPKFDDRALRMCWQIIKGQLDGGQELQERMRNLRNGGEPQTSDVRGDVRDDVRGDVRHEDSRRTSDAHGDERKGKDRTGQERKGLDFPSDVAAAPGGAAPSSGSEPTREPTEHERAVVEYWLDYQPYLHTDYDHTFIPTDEELAFIERFWWNEGPAIRYAIDLAKECEAERAAAKKTTGAEEGA